MVKGTEVFKDEFEPEPTLRELMFFERLNMQRQTVRNDNNNR